MRDFFLGKIWHWLLMAGTAVLLYWAGGARLHVIHFNWFAIALLLGGLAVILLLVWTTRPGEQITRDPLHDDEDD